MTKRVWRDISWTKYCQWLAGKKLSNVEELGDHVRLIFSDGSIAAISSNYEEHAGYSEYTPGWTEATLPTVRVSE